MDSDGPVRYTISQHIKIALNEDKFASRFNQDIMKRTNLMNSTHLYVMDEHLKQVQKHARSKMWKSANQGVFDKVSRELRWREKIIDEEIAQEDLAEERKRKRRETELVKKNEEERVMHAIIANAKRHAKEAFVEKRKQQEAEARVHLREQVLAADSLKLRAGAVATAFLVIATTLVSVLVTDPVYLAIGLASVLIVCAVVALLVYRRTRVVPLTTRSEAATRREEDLLSAAMIQEAIDKLKSDELKYEERMEAEQEERRRLRHVRRVQAREEEEQARLAQTSRTEALRSALGGPSQARRKSVQLLDAFKLGGVAGLDLEERGVRSVAEDSDSGPSMEASRSEAQLPRTDSRLAWSGGTA